MPSRSLRLYVALVATLAVAGLAGTTAVTGTTADEQLAVFAIFAALVAFGERFPLFVLHRGEGEGLQMEEAFIVAMAILLPPFTAVAAFAVGISVGQLARRNSMVKTTFNIAQFLVSGTSAVLVMRLLSPLDHPSPSVLLAVVVGAAVFFVVNNAAVAGVLTLVDDTTFLDAFRDNLGIRVLVWSGNVSVGMLTGLVGSAYAWAIPFAIAPMVMLQLAFGAHLRARRDRERLDGLFNAAIEAHSSMAVDHVEQSLLRSASELLTCRRARIDHLSPEPGSGELGVALRTIAGPQRWLVVGEPLVGDDFDRSDERMLEALGTIGSAAFENARLVEETRRQALHDALTGLPNQVLFEDRLSQALARSDRSGELIAVMFLDLDAFKKVNDSLGHPAGNELLRQVADRLRNAVRGGDTVARLGGDEFTLLVPAVKSAEDARRVAEKVLESLRHPFSVNRHELFMTGSIGIALHPEAGNRPDTLLKNADSAMYRAKERGRNNVQFYSAGMNALAHVRLARESELHNALQRDELHLLYQPQIDLMTDRVVGVEALVRWEHPSLGPVMPDEFIPLAEESGLILALDAWVMRRACEQARSWQIAGLPDLRVAVNLSGRHFHDRRLVDTVSTVLWETGLDPSLLELEVTEGVAVQDSMNAHAMLGELRQLGVGVAIDDFGTGYSVLGRLRGFPADRLKIDRSFVSEIGGESGPIVAAMIAMARGLGLGVVAEGVETVEQQLFLRGLGCDEAQGWLFGRPTTPEEIARLVRPSDQATTVA